MHGVQYYEEFVSAGTTNVLMCVFVCVYAWTVCTQTYIHTYIHKHTYTYIQTHVSIAWYAQCNKEFVSAGTTNVLMCAYLCYSY